MMIRVAGASDRGRVRLNNEDAFRVEPDLALAIVADGMGGHAAGEVASRLAVEEAVRGIREDGDTDPERRTRAAVLRANNLVLQYALDHPEYAGMGTTLDLAWIRGEGIWIGHIGDSRVYRIRRNRIACLTRDHSWVAEQVRTGRLSPEEAAHHPFRNLLTQALGIRPDPEVDVVADVVEPGDAYLLCTDGLMAHLSDADILSIHGGASTAEDRLQLLIDETNRRGGQDNVTVALVEIPPA
ncbi:MAG: Stp1/IreP family PP2C-type Ser/Thr phosphatase [Nitrospirota bacterium]|jgi:protein phosphatase